MLGCRRCGRRRSEQEQAEDGQGDDREGGGRDRQGGAFSALSVTACSHLSSSPGARAARRQARGCSAVRAGDRGTDAVQRARLARKAATGTRPPSGATSPTGAGTRRARRATDHADRHPHRRRPDVRRGGRCCRCFAERLRPVLDGLRGRDLRGAGRSTTAAATPRPRPAASGSARWPQLRVVRLRANAGHQAALSAGLARARGEWVVTLDADLQDPPELIPGCCRGPGGGRRRRLRRADRPQQRPRVQAAGPRTATTG